MSKHSLFDLLKVKEVKMNNSAAYTTENRRSNNLSKLLVGLKEVDHQNLINSVNVKVYQTQSAL